jgi:hypothetical protein
MAFSPTCCIVGPSEPAVPINDPRLSAKTLPCPRQTSLGRDVQVIQVGHSQRVGEIARDAAVVRTRILRNVSQYNRFTSCSWEKADVRIGELTARARRPKSVYRN